MRTPALLLALALLAAAGCDRNLEPYDPDEPVAAPDLSKIFPEGAEQAARPEPALPPAPGAGRGAAPLPQEVAASDAGADGAPIRGRIEIAPELAGGAPRDGVLFIIGRRAEAGPPLAVKRVPRPTFPLSFTLGPDDRMIQRIPFEGPIAITARLDGDGNASSSGPGDLAGEARGGPVDPGAEGVVIVLDTAL